MSTSPIVITPSTSVVLVNTADFSGNPVVLLPNLTGPGVLGRIITVRDNDGGSVLLGKSIYLSTTGGARFQSELSSITLSTISITQPYGFITLTPRLTDGSGNTNYGLMNVYAFPEASPAAYVNTLNANFSYLSTLSTVNLAVSQNTYIQGNLTVNGAINYANPGSAALGVGTLNANTISAATILNSTFNGVNVNASTINTSTFVVRDSGSILLPNASTWSNASAFAGTVDPNSLNLGTPGAGAGAQVGLSSNFFGIRAFTKDSSATTYSTTMVMRDRNVAINPASITGIGIDGNPYSDYRLFVTGSTRMSNQGLNNNTVILKQTGATGCNFEVNEFGGTLGTFRMDTSSNITEGFFGSGLFANQYKWMSASKAGSIQFFTGTSPTADTSARVTIDTAGRVGIGRTPASGYALDVSGGNARITQTGTSANLDFSATGGTFSIIRQTGTNGNVDILNNGTGVLGFGTNGVAGAFQIEQSGSVAIGTAGAVNSAAKVTIQNDLCLVTGANSSGAGGSLYFGIEQFPTYSPMGQIKGILQNATGSETQGGICFYTRPIGTAGQVLTERMRIEAAGNIGIGTSTIFSGYRVDISGNVGLETNSKLIFANENLDNKISLWGGSNSSVYSGFGVRPQTLLYNVPDFANNHVFYASTSRELMRIDGTGNVGIGIASPLTSLDVSGVLTIRGGTTASAFGSATNTYMSFAANGASTDWVNLRQIGGNNAIALCYDFHDDVADVRFVLRNNSIGTPWEVLRVDNDTAGTGSNGTMQVAQFSNATTTTIPALSLRNSSNGDQINFLTKSGTGSFNSIAQINDKSIIFHNGTQNTGNLVIAPWSATGVTSGIRMNTSGQVGIGISNPAYTLDVSGNGRFTNTLQTDSNIEMASGTATFPALTFSGDTDTGIFRPGANRFGISVGGTTRFEISGNELHSFDSTTTTLLSGRLCCAYGVLTDIGTFAFKGFNVGSITDQGTGKYRINLSRSFRTDGLYTVVANGNGDQVNTCSVFNQNSNYFEIITIYNNIGFTPNWTITDTYFAFVVYP